jgi:hypothetical protein
MKARRDLAGRPRLEGDMATKLSEQTWLGGQT